MDRVEVPLQGMSNIAWTRRRVRRAAAGVVALLLLSVAAPAGAEVSRGDLAAADEEVADARHRMGEAESRLAEEQRRLDRIGESLDRIADRMTAQDAAIEDADDDARERITRMYMAAGAGREAGLLAGSGTDLGARVAYLGALADREREFVTRLTASRADLERLSATVRRNLTEQQAVVEAAAAELAAIRDALAEAEGVAAELQAQWQREEEERRRLAEEERLRREEEERLRLEEEERQRQEALAAIEEAAATANAAGWTPGSGVEPWRPLVARYFPEHLVEEALAVMRCESLGNPVVVNPYSGASGLFQQMPFYWPSRAEAAGWSGASIFDPEANIAVSAWLVMRSEESHAEGAWGHWSCKP
jgi:peptidoglycan hydrolase CwlO-like protein